MIQTHFTRASSGFLCHVILEVLTKILKEHTASIVRVERSYHHLNLHCHENLKADMNTLCQSST